MHAKKLLFPALGTLALAVVACGGGGGSSSLPSSGTIQTQAVPVNLRVKIPAAGAHASAKIRARMNEAQSTQGFQVSVNTSPVTTAAFDMRSSNTAQCTTNADLSYTCNFTVNVPPGSYTFTYGSYDAPPSGGVIPGTAHQLGIGSSSGTVVSGTANTQSVVLNGIATSASITLPIPVVHTVNALAQQATVAVLDVDNDVIVSNSYVDSSGNPVTVNLSSNCPLVTVSPAAITAPLANGATVSYDPTNITAAEMTGGTTSTIAAQLGAGPTFSASLTVPPAVQTVTLATPGYGITAQSSSTLWVAEPSGQQIQSVIPLTNTVNAPIPVASAGVVGPSPKPADILYAQDGNLYFTIQNTGAIGRITPAGASETGTALYDSLNPGVSLASDGTNVWTTQPAGKYVEFTPMSSWSITQQNPTVSNGLFQIALGTSGLLYYTAATASLVGTSTTGGSNGGAITLTPGSSPEGIVWDGNQTMWVAESGTNKIAQIIGAPPGETINEYSTGSAVPTWITMGPDGNAWFDYAGASPGIGRVTPNGVVTMYPLPASAVPWQMTSLGAQVWLVDQASGTLYGISV